MRGLINGRRLFVAFDGIYSAVKTQALSRYWPEASYRLGDMGTRHLGEARQRKYGAATR